MSDVLIANEAHDAQIVVVGENDPIIIPAREELSLAVGDGLSVHGADVLIISQAATPLMVTQGETGFVLDSGQHYRSVDGVDAIFISGEVGE